MKRWKDRWALVTGASSGIGEAFARLLAEQGAHLVLVARRQDRLEALSKELAAAHGVQTRVEALDLAAPGACEALHRRTREAGLEIDLLVNNAGFGVYGPHMEIPWEREQQMLQLDIVALSDLTKRYVADMLARDRGWVIQVASIGGYQPAPTYAAYSAAKAYVLNLTEALNYELRGTGVKVSALSPGVTRTEFFEVSGQAPSLFQRLTVMPAERVAQVGLDAVWKGRPSVIPGFVNRFNAFFLRFLPRRLQAAIASATMNLGQ